ncbi:unnamed protein product [Mycena citricolor]|uniref:Uncharacterized protein n=1 Tax=Mycena citricolor TaxID=2018698 RepID=A0AAD2GTW8_9AGAR|nr:unnamed protein product [Mycena citricolor]
MLEFSTSPSPKIAASPPTRRNRESPQVKHELGHRSRRALLSSCIDIDGARLVARRSPRYGQRPTRSSSLYTNLDVRIVSRLAILMDPDLPPDVSGFLMPSNDHDHVLHDLDLPFSFPGYPSHGFDCTTTASFDFGETHRPDPGCSSSGYGFSSVYPSPPSPASREAGHLPLPGTGAAHQFGGLLDSPVVHVLKGPPTAASSSTPSSMPLSPPPTIQTPIHSLPPSDPYVSPPSPLRPLLRIAETAPATPQQLLSPISPEWPIGRKPADELFAEGGSMLMSEGDYVSGDVYGSADEGLVEGSAAASVLLGCADVPASSFEDSATSPLDELLSLKSVAPDTFSNDSFLPLSPSPSPPRTWMSPPLELSPPFDWDQLEYSPPCSPALRSFASLSSDSASDELEEIDWEIEAERSVGMSPACRIHLSSLPAFEADDDLGLVDPDTDIDTPFPGSSADPLELSSLRNALCLNVPDQVPPAKPPSILDPFSFDELLAWLPPHLDQDELKGLYRVRSNAHAMLDACSIASSSSSQAVPDGITWDHELRKNVPRDSGEPRRIRKRAKEQAREVDAMIGLALGLLPESEPRKEKNDDCWKRDKAGLAGLESIDQLVARMILRRRERCVRGLESPRKLVHRPSALSLTTSANSPIS